MASYSDPEKIKATPSGVATHRLETTVLPYGSAFNAIAKMSLQLCDSAGSSSLQKFRFCLFLSTCVKQSVCVYTMDFVSGHKQIN